MEKKLWTVGQIARRLGIPQANVAYHITKNQIKEERRCGIIRLFSQEKVKQLKSLMGL